MKKIPIRKIKSPTPEQVSSVPFNIRKVEEILQGKDLNHSLHRHDFYFILALNQGEGMHNIDFEPYELTGNVVFCVRPGQVHELQLKSSCSGYLMEFDVEFYRPNEKVSAQKLRKATYKNFCQLTEQRFEKILTILKNIFEENAIHEAGYQTIIKSSLDIFFIELARQSQNPDATPSNANNYVQERLEEFLELLQINITSHKQVSHYTKMMNLSSYQLNEITKNTVGKTASDLINEQIMLEARRYLLASTDQIKEISEVLGYEDVSYFIRFFKKHSGLSPDAFRQNFK